MRKDNTIEAFFALVRGGLWETEVQLASYGKFDYENILRIAREQSVVGLVAAGLEHITDVIVPQVIALQFAGETLQLEQRNKAMNDFLARLISNFRYKGINAILVKGQGIAQCYERPLWRSSGDVDLLLDSVNFVKAQQFLMPISIRNEGELKEEKHHEFEIGPWVVELHGNMPTHFSTKADRLLEELQIDAFNNNRVRVWHYKEKDIKLLNVDADIIFVFTHILKHFFRGGIGIRQICDWCRLMWIYKDQIDIDILENRLNQIKLLTEWKAFAALAVNELGYPVEYMPLYSNEAKWERKSSRILSFILKTGNFGHNRDTRYYQKYPYLITKVISFYWRFSDNIKYFVIFPADSFKVLCWLFRHGLKNLKRA